MVSIDLNSDLKDIKILVLSGDQKIIDKLNLESLDSSQKGTRFIVYPTNSLNEASSFVKKHDINYAIIDETIHDYDFIYCTTELISKNDNIKILAKSPSIPTIAQLNEAKSLKNLIGFIENLPTSLDEVENMLYQLLRVQSAEIENELESNKNISNSLLLSNKDWVETKKASNVLINYLVGEYDFNIQQKQEIIIAESIYFPWLSLTDYESMKIQNQNVFKILCDSGSDKENRSPKSLNGFLITFSSFVSDNIVKGNSSDSILKELQNRPNHLKHRSIREFENISKIEFITNFLTNINLKRTGNE